MSAQPPVFRVKREARLERIHALQGIRAGFVSRMLAYVVDVVVLFVLAFLILCFIALVRWVVGSKGFHIDRPEGWLSVVLSFAFATLYFDYLWTATGRSLGEQFFGLRTLRSDGSRLRGWHALLRGALYAAFPVGLLWIVVSRRNSAVQDLICGTAVVYDWSYHPPGG